MLYVERFVADKDPAKRARLIDKLLARPEHALFWAQRWADLLRVSEQRLTAVGARKYHEWIVKAVRDNTPWDQFAMALLTASGDTYKNPPANYYRAAGDTAAVTETTAQLFMGVRIGCAKCHNHPFESWTQDDYYGISAVFNGVERQGGKASIMISLAERRTIARCDRRRDRPAGEVRRSCPRHAGHYLRQIATRGHFASPGRDRLPVAFRLAWTVRVRVSTSHGLLSNRRASRRKGQDRRS